MTYLKSKLMITAVVLACAGTPAFADHHGGDAMKKTMEKSETMMMKTDAKAAMSMDQKKMKWQAMSAEDRKMKIQNMSAKDYKKWMAMPDADRKTMISWMSDDEKALFKAGKKQHMMKKNMTGDHKAHKKMMKDGMHHSKMNDTVGEVLQDAANDGRSQNRAIVVPSVNSAPITTVNCPSGTTAQPDGTCMMTSDATFDYNTSTTVKSGGMMKSETTMMNDGKVMGENGRMMQTTTATTRFTTEGKPYMGTLDPAAVFGNR